MGGGRHWLEVCGNQAASRSSASMLDGCITLIVVGGLVGVEMLLAAIDLSSLCVTNANASLDGRWVD